MGTYLLTCTKCGINFPEGKQAWKEHCTICKGRTPGVVNSISKPIEKIKDIQQGFKRKPPKSQETEEKVIETAIAPVEEKIDSPKPEAPKKPRKNRKAPKKKPETRF